MGIGYLSGHWADGKLNTKFLALVGLLIGVFAGFRTLMRAASLMQREADREAADEVAARAERQKLDEEAQSFSSHPPEPLVRTEPATPPSTPAPPASSGRMATSVNVNARGSKDGDAPS